MFLIRPCHTLPDLDNFRCADLWPEPSCIILLQVARIPSYCEGHFNQLVGSLDINARHVDMSTNWRAFDELARSRLDLNGDLDSPWNRMLQWRLVETEEELDELQRELDDRQRARTRRWWSVQRVEPEVEVIGRMRILILLQHEELKPATTPCARARRIAKITQSYEEQILAMESLLAKLRNKPRAQHLEALFLRLRKPVENSSSPTSCTISISSLGESIENYGDPTTSTGSIQHTQQEQIDKALTQPYKYEDLHTSQDAIRLVRVNLIEGRSGEINCNLGHHNMRELVGSRSYHAISYVWGDSARNKKLLCDDYTSFLPVTRNLRDILGALALESSESASSRPYWIDGICINQEDEQERGHQVRKMAKIYRRAACVHIFLGSISRSQSILQSQWLSRRWVIQEAVAAQKLVVHLQRDGEWEKLTWPDFVAIVSNDGVAPQQVELLPASNLLRGLAKTKATRWSGIFSLLLRFHATECHDDRDRLYALLGVSSDVELQDEPDMTRADMAQVQALKIWFQPSYTLSTAQVYQKFAVAAIQSLSAFDLLHCAGAFRCIDVRDATDTSLPSWVPDWRYPPRYKPLLRAMDCRAGILQGAGRKKTPGQGPGKHAIVMEEDDTLIAIKGLTIGKVDCFIDTPSEPDTVPQYHTVIVEWSPDPVDFNFDRAYVLLDSGFTAYVPIDVRHGDEVVIPVGARTPFVLREFVRTDPICHELIGDCFVLDKGVMDGTYIRPLVESSFTEFYIV
ncbi:heterokaryon incompatibility protein-domain-containing protein [Paraphoma chrysanthemicola]|uniref:Heterokaryon incompatibility protein-domain-containing protein n=1 Tax=Paraphoma chrysanthemicola TaxID=798071 RepID=A0A8K0VXV9_9PLEO|nr:heterokaryon incompatibility protein-domain-containing protein [Paraphoma chrysanthemicola]